MDLLVHVCIQACVFMFINMNIYIICYLLLGRER